MANTNTTAEEWQAACATFAGSFLRGIIRTAGGDQTYLHNLGLAAGAAFRLDGETVKIIRQAERNIIDAIERAQVMPITDQAAKAAAAKSDADFQRFLAGLPG